MTTLKPLALIMLVFTLGAGYANAWEPPEDAAKVDPPTVSLQPVTDRPEGLADQPALQLALPVLRSATPAGGLGSVFAGTMESFSLDPIAAQRFSESIELEGGEDFLETVSKRARAGYAFDTEFLPRYSDRQNIHLAANVPDDPSASHFTVAEVPLGRGVAFRTDGINRPYFEDRRYLTLSAEAYFSLGANAGMALGFDVLRAGVPTEELSPLMEEGLFARFIIGF